MVILQLIVFIMWKSYVDTYAVWGSPEYVEAMWCILKADHADDFVIAAGETNSLKDFVDQSFACFGLDCAEHVLHGDQIMWPNEIAWSQETLDWQASKRMRAVVKILCEAQ